MSKSRPVTPHVMTSPSTTGPTPAGVPVNTMSPSCSVMACVTQLNKDGMLKIMWEVAKNLDLHCWNSQYYLLHHYYNWASILAENGRKIRFIMLRHMISRVDFLLHQSNPKKDENHQLMLKILKIFKLRKTANREKRLLRKKMMMIEQR